MWLGRTIRFQNEEFKVVGLLPEHLVVIRNTGTYPASPALIPKPPEFVDNNAGCYAESPLAVRRDR